MRRLLTQARVLRLFPRMSGSEAEASAARPEVGGRPARQGGKRSKKKAAQAETAGYAATGRHGPSGQELRGPEQRTTVLEAPDEEFENPLRTPGIEAENVHKVYDAIASHWNHTRYKAWPKVEAFVLSLPKGSLVADLGCGNGKNLPHAKAAGCFPIASDISAPLARIAAEEHGTCCMVADCLAAPLRGGAFDAVLSIAVLHHLSTPARRVQALREGARLLRCGGLFLVYCWSYEQDQRSRSRHRFEAQDVLVPWSFRTPGVKKAKDAGPEEPEGWEQQPPVCQRYCHVYREGELEELLQEVPELELVSSYFDTGNWCAIAKRRKLEELQLHEAIGRSQPRHARSDRPDFLADSYHLGFQRLSPDPSPMSSHVRRALARCERCPDGVETNEALLSLWLGDYATAQAKMEGPAAAALRELTKQMPRAEAAGAAFVRRRMEAPRAAAAARAVQLCSGALPARDGTALGYVLLLKEASAPLVVRWGGNAELAGLAAQSELQDLVASGLAEMLLLDFRGFGWSGGSPAMATLRSDAQDAMHALPAVLQEHGRDPEAHRGVVLFGRSIGSLCALHCAMLGYGEALVLDSPVTCQWPLEALPWAPLASSLPPLKEASRTRVCLCCRRPAARQSQSAWERCQLATEFLLRAKSAALPASPASPALPDDRKLRNYKIVISKETRSIPLAKFREVFQGAEPEDIATPLDQLCATFAVSEKPWHRAHRALQAFGSKP
ncbi:unnamed protein product [Effrenium voratum]|uniref:Methyltransferase type 11 domain-containing protein n=1 Tax=Effrenium voratum TaxID=2562239 RepID=A0AA36IIN0_9DINO|nr:unnamed protein product [Effrenium voratum]